LLRLQLLHDGAARALRILAARRNDAAQLADTSLANDRLARLAADPGACEAFCQVCVWGAAREAWAQRGECFFLP
jgi:hypothetical protein